MNLSALAAGAALTSDGAGVAADAVMAEAIRRLQLLGRSLGPDLAMQAIDTAVLVGDGARADALIQALNLDVLDMESIDTDRAALVFRAAQRKW